MLSGILPGTAKNKFMIMKNCRYILVTVITLFLIIALQSCAASRKAHGCNCGTTQRL